MRALYKRLNSPTEPTEEEKWGIVGLLHDADYEETRDYPEKHTFVLEQKIGRFLPEDVIYAIKCHNFENTGVEPKSLMDWSIYCCDELTGIIIAAALIHPRHKLEALDSQFIINRMKEKSFARGANRESIMKCQEKLNLLLPEFIEIVLKSMQEISNQLCL